GGGIRPDQFRSAPLPGGPSAPRPQNDPTVYTPPPSRPTPPPANPGQASWQQQQPGQNARYGMPEASDDWMKGNAGGAAFFPGSEPAAPLPEAREKIPLDVALNARDATEYSAANPITTAAAPLLILLGRLRLLIVEMQAVPLMNHVANAIREFERKVTEAGVPAEDVRIAKYALCGTADDIVQNLPGTDRHVWMQY